MESDELIGSHLFIFTKCYPEKPFIPPFLKFIIELLTVLGAMLLWIWIPSKTKAYNNIMWLDSDESMKIKNHDSIIWIILIFLHYSAVSPAPSSFL